MSNLFLCQSNLLFVLSGDWSSLLDNVELDVAVGGKVWGDSTMGSVGSSSSADSSLSGNMRDLALFGIESLGLSVGLEVDKESSNVLDGLGWESTVVMTDVLAHGVSSWTTGVSSERNDGSVGGALIHVVDGLKEHHTSASSGGLVGVLVMSSQVSNSATSGYKKRKELECFDKMSN